MGACIDNDNLFQLKVIIENQYQFVVNSRTLESSRQGSAADAEAFIAQPALHRQPRPKMNQPAHASTLKAPLATKSVRHACPRRSPRSARRIEYLVVFLCCVIWAGPSHSEPSPAEPPSSTQDNTTDPPPASPAVGGDVEDKKDDKDADDARASSPAADDDTVVVTGTRTPGRYADVPIATEVIKRAEIERSGARTAADVLETQGGMIINRSFRGAGVSLQGLDARQTLILMDGERVTGKVEGVVDLDRIRSEHIERIEIVRGAGSAVYGADAIGGVINIITRKTRRALGAMISASAGDDDALDVSGVIQGGTSSLRTRISAGFHALKSYDLEPADEATTGSQIQDLQIAQRTDWHQSKALKLSLTGDYALRDREGVDVSGPGALFDRTQQTESHNWIAGLRWRGQAKRAVASLHYTHLVDQFLSDQRGSDALDKYERTTLSMLNGNTQFDMTAFGWHHLSIGLDGAIETARTPRISIDEAERLRGAIYLQDQWTVSDTPYFVVVTGVRLDADSDFGMVATPRIALRYDPIESLILRASVGRGYRAPEFKELYLRFENKSAGYVVSGNPDLEPERALSLQFGLDYQPTPSTVIRLSAFRNDVDGLVSFEGLDSGEANAADQYRYANLDQGMTQGLESELELRLWHAVRSRVGYTFLHTRGEQTDLDGVRRIRPLEGRPTHQAHAELSTTWSPAGLEASVRGVFIGARPSYLGTDSETTVPSHINLSTRLGWSPFPVLTIFVRGENLLDVGDPIYVPIRPRRFSAGLMGRM